MKDKKKQMTMRLLEAIEQMEFGISLMKQNLSRRNIGASEEVINSELQRWLVEQPRFFFSSKKEK